MIAHVDSIERDGAGYLLRVEQLDPVTLTVHVGTARCTLDEARRAVDTCRRGANRSALASSEAILAAILEHQEAHR